MVGTFYTKHPQNGYRQLKSEKIMSKKIQISGALREDALKGKTFVVTGGGTGLGRSMGTYLLKLGANLVIGSRKLDVLEKAAAEMSAETGGQVLPVACD